jgi:acyl carrier protein
MLPTDPIPVLRQFLLTELLGEASSDPVEPDTNLLAGGWLDSMGVVRLVAFIEQQFHLRVPPEDVTLDNFQTLTAISHYLERRRTP